MDLGEGSSGEDNSPHALYRALRGPAAEDPLEDEVLWEGDYMDNQREHIQKQMDEQLLQRIERRIGGCGVVHWLA